MSPDFDTVIVGAGVIGLAIAWQLANAGRSVIVLEGAPRAGTETSSRNSEVIHAGIYYPTGTLKARLCVEGRKLLYAYCASRGVETKRVGKIIVATSAHEETKLQAIKSMATANDVDDVEWLTHSDVVGMEPELRFTRALFSQSTGIVDAVGFMLALHGEAEGQGTTFAFNTSFVAARNQGDVFFVTASDKDGDVAELSCRTLINCAGHGAHQVAKCVESYPLEKLPPQYFAKGNYCSLSGRSPFKHLVYPVPVSGALGIHATLDLAGAARFGPDIQWVDKLDHAMPPNLPETFTSAVERYWPAVRDRELTASYCGIRPKIHGPKETFADFEIQRHAEHGLAGLINLFGIESPGLTASLAIAVYIERYLHSDLQSRFN
jgi:L-2-hydroxyglutarate oxidase LhgO